MSTQRRQPKAVTSEGDSTTKAPATDARPVTKKTLRKAFIERQKKNNAFLNSPTFKVLLFTLGAIVAFVLTRPYWKPSAVLGNTPPKAAFNKDPIIIKHPSRDPNSNGRPYAVVELPGKGKGMVAARLIQRGELILKDKPVLRLPATIADGETPSDYILRHFANLSAEDKEKFLALSHAPEDAKTEADIPLAIIQTNAFSAGEYMAVFPDAARMNHGCSSAFNAVYSWREDEMTLYVYALRDIPAGDEILTTYTDTKKPRDERRAFLASQYHFHCTCPVCALPDSLSKQSDIRLHIISSLYGKLPAWNKGEMDGKEAIDILNQIWELGELEGYKSERGQLAADAALVATAHADREAAKQWRQLAAKWFRYELGDDSEQVQLNLQWAARPKSHPAWGAKKNPMKVGGPTIVALEDNKPKEEK